MKIITQEYVINTYNKCIEKSESIFHGDTWVHAPKGVSFDTHKSKYGQVNDEGLILINPAFIGTDAFGKLQETMYHEIAHLIIGLDQHHNKRFKRVENALIKDLNVEEAERQKVKNNNGYKFRLLAYTSKNIFDCGGAFRRTKTYTQYKPSDNIYRSIKGQRITHFKYVSFEESLPAGTITDISQI